jgi:hypothetical protein
MLCACLNARFVEQFNATVGSPIECSNLKLQNSCFSPLSSFQSIIARHCSDKIWNCSHRMFGMKQDPCHQLRQT